MAYKCVTYKTIKWYKWELVYLYTLPTCESNTRLALALVAVASFNLLLLPLSECRYKSAAVSWSTSIHRVNPAIHLMLNLKYIQYSLIMCSLTYPRVIPLYWDFFLLFQNIYVLCWTQTSRENIPKCFNWNFIEELCQYMTVYDNECMFLLT